MAPTILIPAYEPGESLVEVVRALLDTDPSMSVLVVDDGSGTRYADVFQRAAAAGAELLVQHTNRGKGAALKAGYAHIARQLPARSVVCADSDGQHTPTDICRVAAALTASSNGTQTIVLGAREFIGRVPWKSRLGNSLTQRLFRVATGVRLADTQTGLRAYPPVLLDWLQAIPGDRFEYELDVLLAATSAGIAIEEVPIATIYLDGNASTHFRPLHDSARTYRVLFRHLGRRLFVRVRQFNRSRGRR